MLEILASVVEEPILQEIQTSMAIGLELDESTDVSVTRQLDLHIRYADKEGQLFSQFLDIVRVPDGKAVTIVRAVKDVLHKKYIPTAQLYGLGTDGAAVMTGRQNGVAKLLQDDYPWVVHVACAAHRLALACRDATMGVQYMATFRDHLQQLHLYFHNSANRTEVLLAASGLLGLKDLKVTEVKDTRWLSQHLAIQSLQRNLPSVLSALAEEVKVNKCPTAKGLYAFCSTFRFVAALHLQADVLPHLARLSKVFQKEMVNFLAIKEQVPVAMAAIRAIKEAGNQQPPGSCLAEFHSNLHDPAGLGGFDIASHEEERDRRGRVSLEGGDDFWSRFQRQVMDPYLDGLLNNLDRRFENLDILGAFHIFGAAPSDLENCTSNLQILSQKFLPQQPEHVVLQEWESFKHHLVVGAFQVEEMKMPSCPT
ncbi:zinc finger protein 862-like [Brachyhypopomus gauderio]|uniref:zinc finger protein 862-like n=2 Tax=Brachyhypopomus gauderio TaxID=698409 RepID=UPI0040428ED3